mmetsp:Transcript_40166/g.48672  ORF Transcript_40166/g.48672 Transcript_40166/m.48672 type:complete len:825 (+) Transcript_40166:86-2560(+)|eukprot:CAMPEP_0197858920 /NCGR_PEP_ID=MMETSP1438-20131217/33088_1 /TAXON_ID=1461541 /ORGANISM="Pterosperma sp., Strain CCMP1384" /LENGTH=824 /DNA_ID=CAMNT_0043475229 /DNA_START=86 /DNA_END=2560 /DNA_ORIENTATION=+
MVYKEENIQKEISPRSTLDAQKLDKLDNWDSMRTSKGSSVDWFAEVAPPEESRPSEAFRRSQPASTSQPMGATKRLCPVCGQGFAPNVKLRVHMMCQIAQETSTAQPENSPKVSPIPPLHFPQPQLSDLPTFVAYRSDKGRNPKIDKHSQSYPNPTQLSPRNTISKRPLSPIPQAADIPAIDVFRKQRSTSAPSCSPHSTLSARSSLSASPILTPKSPLPTPFQPPENPIPNTIKLEPLPGVSTSKQRPKRYLDMSKGGLSKGVALDLTMSVRKPLNQLYDELRSNAAITIQRIFKGWLVRRFSGLKVVKTELGSIKLIPPEVIRQVAEAHAAENAAASADVSSSAKTESPEVINTNTNTDSSTATNQSPPKPSPEVFIQEPLRSTLHRNFMNKVKPTVMANLDSADEKMRDPSAGKAASSATSCDDTAEDDDIAKRAMKAAAYVSGAYSYSAASESRPLPFKPTLLGHAEEPTKSSNPTSHPENAPKVSTSYAYSALSDSRPMPFKPSKLNNPPEEPAARNPPPQPQPAKRYPSPPTTPPKPNPQPNIPRPPPARTSPNPPPRRPAPSTGPTPTPNAAQPPPSKGFTCPKCSQMFEFKIRLQLHWCNPSAGNQRRHQQHPQHKTRYGAPRDGQQTGVGGEAYFRRVQQEQEQRRQQQQAAEERRRREAEERKRQADAARRQREARDKRGEQFKAGNQGANSKASAPGVVRVGRQAGMPWAWYVRGAESRSPVSPMLAGQSEEQINEYVRELIQRHTSPQMSIAELIGAFGIAVGGDNERALKVAFRKAAIQFHPDKNQGAPPHQRIFAEEAFKVIKLAVEGLV